MPWLIIRLRHLLCTCQSCPPPPFLCTCSPLPCFPSPTSDLHFAQPTVHRVAVPPCPLSIFSFLSLSPLPAFHKPFFFCCPCLVPSLPFFPLPFSSSLILSPLLSSFSFFSLFSFSFLCCLQFPVFFFWLLPLPLSPSLSCSLCISPLSLFHIVSSH